MKLKIYLDEDKKFVNIFAQVKNDPEQYYPIVFDPDENKTSILAFKLFFDDYSWRKIEKELLENHCVEIKFGLTQVTKLDLG